MAQHVFQVGDYNKIVALNHRIQVIMAKVAPHIQNAHYRKVNEDIVADVDKQHVRAQLTNNASLKHVQEVVR